MAARLVTADGETVQIAHESLARAWPRLADWLEEDVEGQRILRHLSASADAWDGMGRPDSELYRGARLTRALDWQHTAGPGSHGHRIRLHRRQRRGPRRAGACCRAAGASAGAHSPAHPSPGHRGGGAAGRGPGRRPAGGASTAATGGGRPRRGRRRGQPGGRGVPQRPRRGSRVAARPGSEPAARLPGNPGRPRRSAVRAPRPDPLAARARPRAGAGGQPGRHDAAGRRG